MRQTEHHQTSSSPQPYFNPRNQPGQAKSHPSLQAVPALRARLRVENPKILSSPLTSAKPVPNPETKPLPKMKWIADELWCAWYTGSSE
jgi:hypothetical protein